MASVVDGKHTVRETRDNLMRIEEVLLEFDRPTPVDAFGGGIVGRFDLIFEQNVGRTFRTQHTNP